MWVEHWFIFSAFYRAAFKKLIPTQTPKVYVQHTTSYSHQCVSEKICTSKTPWGGTGRVDKAFALPFYRHIRHS